MQKQYQPSMLSDAAQKQGGLIILLGVLSVVAGAMAIAAPFVAGATATMLVGGLILASGIMELIAAFHQSGWRAGLPAFLGGLLAVIGGGLILAHPLFGMALLVLVLAFYFVIDGVGRIAFALRLRPTGGWGIVLVGGVMTLLLGILLYAQWPLSGAWAIGTLIGIRILFSGWALILLGSAARNLSKV